MATKQDKKINEYKKNPTVAESAYVVGLNSNDENINIPRATLAEIVRQELYSILNASGADQGTTVTKVPVLGGNRIGSSSIADLASVLGVARGRFTPSGQGDSYTISTYAGLLYVFDGSNGNAYLYLIHIGTVDEIFKGALNVNLSVERVDATHTRIIRITASTQYISWTYINGII